MADASLTGCWAKQRRAEEHLNALSDEITRYVEDHPHRAFGKFDRDTCTFRLRANVLKKPDTDRWGVILGDLVHNLRCVLDHLVWQLAVLDGAKPGGHLQFPIESTGTGYWSPRKDGPSTRELRLKGISDKHRALIDALQPYRGAHRPGTNALSILASLSNIDKHRFLHATTFGYDPDDDSFKLIPNQDAGGIESIEFDPFPEEGEAEVMRAKFTCPGPNPQVDMQGEVPVYIAFGDPRVRLQDVQTVLVHIGSILKTFEPDFLS